MAITGEEERQGANEAEVAGGEANAAPAGTHNRRIRIVDAGRTIELEDPLPGAAPEQIRQLLSQQIRRLTGARLEEKREGDTQWLVFSVQTGVKGRG